MALLLPDIVAAGASVTTAGASGMAILHHRNYRRRRALDTKHLLNHLIGSGHSMAQAARNAGVSMDELAARVHAMGQVTGKGPAPTARPRPSANPDTTGRAGPNIRHGYIVVDQRKLEELEAVVDGRGHPLKQAEATPPPAPAPPVEHPRQPNRPNPTVITGRIHKHRTFPWPWWLIRCKCEDCTRTVDRDHIAAMERKCQVRDTTTGELVFPPLEVGNVIDGRMVVQINVAGEPVFDRPPKPPAPQRDPGQGRWV